MKHLSQSESIEILHKIVKDITGKDICYKLEHKQDEKFIYYTTSFGILHELCHWISAYPEDKLKPNLGFDDNSIFFEDLTENLYYQECNALFLSCHLYRKFFNYYGIDGKVTDRTTKDYVKYCWEKSCGMKSQDKNLLENEDFKKVISMLDGKYLYK